MELSNKLVTTVITLAVVIISVATILMPVISDAQHTAGEEVTITNETRGPYTADYSDTDFTMTITPTNDDAGYALYVDDEGFAKPSTTLVALISDKLIVRFANSTTRTTEVTYATEDTVASFNDTSDPVTITYDADTATLTYVGTNTITLEDVAFVFTLASTGIYSEIISDLEYSSMCLDEASIENNTAGVLMYRSTITVGDTSALGLITASKYGITAFWASDVDWTVSLEFNGLALKDGYTDIYTNGTPTFVVSDGTNTASVVAQRSYILTEVSGHEASGAAYSLYAAIPIIVIVGIVIASIGMVVTRRD